MTRALALYALLTLVLRARDALRFRRMARLW